MKLYFIALVLLSLLCGCASTQADRSAAEPLSTMDAENIKVMQERQALGALLASQDKLAWIASDTLVISISTAALDKLEGYVAQGSVQNGFVVFYGKQDDKIVQIARLDFRDGKIAKNYEESPIEDDALAGLVAANSSANKFFDKSADKLSISYNSYIIENENGYTSYFMPGSTNDYMVFGGCFKLTAGKSLDWNIEKIHKSPMAIKFSDMKKSTILMRTSSVGDVLSETDYAQFYITKEWAPMQYVRTDSYTFLLKYDDASGIINSLMVK